MQDFRASLLVVGLACAVLPCRADALTITELLAINDTVLVDEDGEYSDWLEVHNDAAVPVDVDGWYLTDDDADLTRWQFPSTTIAAGGYIVVFASDKNRAVSGSELHTNFKLSGGGEYLALVRPDGIAIEHEYAPGFPEQTSDVSWGLASDLTTQRCFLTPTPGVANDESTGCGTIEPLEFSVERGFYFAPLSVEIMTPTSPGVTIHYTTDGSTPTESTGSVYSDPITVSTTTAVRAYAFGPGLASPPVTTHTYIYPLDVILQSEAALVPEYPDKWTGGVHADYDMDPDVVFDAAYAGEIVTDLMSIPTMSVVTDKDNLFDSQIGIYLHTNAHGVAWERPISMEIIYADGREGVQENAGIRIQGEYSRSPNNKKHSFRVSFKNIYGANVLDWPLLPTSEIDTVDQLILTGGHGNSWHNGFSAAQYIRDTFAKDTQLDMGHLSPHCTYVHLYLNGLYWGVYRATERPNGGFLSEHLGGDKEDWDALNAGKAVDGNTDAWLFAQQLANSGVGSQTVYEDLEQYVDMPNLIDYFIVNQYGNNTDWDSKNWYAGRRRDGSEGGFRFFSWDAEQTLASPNGSRISMNIHKSPSSIYSDLKKENPEFRLLYGDHVHRHFFHDGALTPARVIERWMRRANEISSAIVAESARWGDKGREEPFTRDVEWIAEQKRLVYAYFSKRTTIAIAQYRKADLYPQLDAPEFNQHGGDIDAGFELTMSAPAGTILYTTDGSDPRLLGGAISPLAQTYTLPITLAGTTTVMARAMLAGEWSALNEARFMLESPIRITEIHFNVPGEDLYEFVEVANTGHSSVDVGGYAFTNGVAFTFPPLLMAPGDHAVVTRNAAAFAAEYGSGIMVAGEFPTSALDNSGERLELRDAAGNVIHDFVFNDQWYYTTDGSGPSLIVRDESQTRAMWRRPEGWRASAHHGGSPGAAESPLCSDGVDNDQDGLADLADAGCGSAAQDSESPQCNDGLDNDKDGLIDVADTDCVGGADDREGPEPVSPFVCYKTRENKALPRFDEAVVILDDELEGRGPFVVRRPKALCLASAVNELAIVDADVQLQSFDLRTDSGGPAPAAIEALLTETFVGPLTLDISKADRILIPTTLDDRAPPVPPTYIAHGVDHYKCYRSKYSRGTPKWLPSGAWLGASNDIEAKNYRIKPPKHFCVPVGVDGQLVKSPERYLMCYSAKRSKYDDKHEKAIGLHTANALHAGLVDTRKEEEICVPASLPQGP